MPSFQVLKNNIGKWLPPVYLPSKIIISLSRDSRKMSEENTHNECKFLGHERPLGLEWPKNLHEWWVFPTNFQKSQSREWYLFHNDVFPNSCEENEWGKQSLEWGKYCQNDTMSICLPSLVWRRWNGFCLSQGAISSHEWPSHRKCR